jgi:uncharacterized protein (DUF305 family)
MFSQWSPVRPSRHRDADGGRRPLGRLAAVGLAGILTVGLSGCIVVSTGQRDADRDDMHDGMRGGSSESGEFSRADVMFAQMMIPHHEQAIEMSDLILAEDGASPEVVALAEQITAAQSPEIEQMESWLEEWGVPAMRGDGHGAMGGMGGMLSEAEMDALEAADGAEAERLYLEGMIEHHEGAIAMADQHQENGENAEALELTASIIESQTAEIELMQELLAGPD